MQNKLSSVESRLYISERTQGATQFLTNRAEMLNAFDTSKAKEAGRPIKVGHGKIAESQFRHWLESFLPKRFGVTAGFIVSQGLRDDQPLPHYDVIVYDALNAPVLWQEDSPDSTPQGKSRAIPCEHVKAVFEVKSRFSSNTVKQVITQLEKLNAFLAKTDEETDKWKLHLPSDFFSMAVFFELDANDAQQVIPLNNLAAPFLLRGFEGGIILRGNTHLHPNTGRIQIGTWNEAVIQAHNEREWPTRTLLNGGHEFSEAIEDQPNNHRGHLNWSVDNFAATAFDIISLLDGSYERGLLSSWHAKSSLINPIRIAEKQTNE